VLLASSYAEMDRAEDAAREMQFALALRPNDSSMLYNCACIYCKLRKKPEALEALKKARDAGFKDPDWARRDPDLTLLHGDPEFERLYPAPAAGGGAHPRLTAGRWASPILERSLMAGAVGRGERGHDRGKR